MKALVFFLISLVLSTTASATPVLYRGVDVSIAVEYFRDYVRTLKQNYTVYNWSRNGALEPGPRTYAYTVTSARLFWDAFGPGDKGANVFGSGLYVAVDPWVTASYGGIDDQWLLTEIVLPAGLQVVDLRLPLGRSLQLPSAEIRALKFKFGCEPTMTVESMFQANGVRSCTDFIRFIFRDQLQIDAFIYDYLGSRYPVCDFRPRTPPAIVITNNRWLKPEIVRAYNARTRDDIENRRRLQTIVLNSAGGNVSEISMTVATQQYKRILWPDLLGQPAFAGFAEWMRAHKFECVSGAPFQP